MSARQLCAYCNNYHDMQIDKTAQLPTFPGTAQ